MGGRRPVESARPVLPVWAESACLGLEGSGHVHPHERRPSVDSWWHHVRDGLTSSEANVTRPFGQWSAGDGKISHDDIRVAGAVLRSLDSEAEAAQVLLQLYVRHRYEVGVGPR